MQTPEQIEKERDLLRLSVDSLTRKVAKLQKLSRDRLAKMNQRGKLVIETRAKLSQSQRQRQDLLEANNRYLERARQAEGHCSELETQAEEDKRTCLDFEAEVHKLNSQLTGTQAQVREGWGKAAEYAEELRRLKGMGFWRRLVWAFRP